MTFKVVGPARHRTFPSASWRTGLRRRLSAGGLACAAALAAASATAVPAEAARAATRAYFWVAPTSTSTLNTSCSTAGYHTVQSAVVAAEAYESAHPTVVPTIEICPATYSEQVTVTSSLIMTRAKGSQGPAVIQLPAAVGQSTSLGLSTTNCQAKDATSHPATQVPQSVIQVCAAKAGGVNAGRVSVSLSRITIASQQASA